MMNEPIPKPCKCGNTFVGPTHHFDIVSLKTVYHVSCLICGKQGESKDTPEGAIEAWNKEDNDE